MRCDHCGAHVPEGLFCTVCGAHQGTIEGVGDQGDRLHRFAAHPGEHVATPNIFTTIFPHLASHRVHEFRYAFLGGIAVLAILAAAGLIVAAILVAAVLVPVLYLTYLYEAQVYRDEPAVVLGLTMGLGAVLGVVFTVIVNVFLTPNPTSRGYSGALDEVLATIVIPLIQLAVLTLPALLLRNRAAYSETADGLVFGVAAGLGFAAAETIVRFANTIGSLAARTAPGSWIYVLASAAIFIPLLHGTAAGAVVASLWPRPRTARSRTVASLGLPAAAMATVLFYLGSQLLLDWGVAPIIELGWQAAVVGMLVVYLRFLLHFALLDEATDMGFSPQICGNCHRHVMAAGFCPVCGQALSAGSRRVTAVAEAVIVTTEGA
jgi:RsiW-degrading membrane proteinase PrsW (M82 family)